MGNFQLSMIFTYIKKDDVHYMLVMGDVLMCLSLD